MESRKSSSNRMSLDDIKIQGIESLKHPSACRVADNALYAIVHVMRCLRPWVSRYRLCLCVVYMPLECRSTAHLRQCYCMFPFLFFFTILWPSNAQMLVLPKTMTAPKRTPGGSLFPNSQRLKHRLTSFLTLSAMETPSADVRALRALTPRMQANCVPAFSARLKTCFGSATPRTEGVSAIGGSKTSPEPDVEVDFMCRNWYRRGES